MDGQSGGGGWWWSALDDVVDVDNRSVIVDM